MKPCPEWNSVESRTDPELREKYLAEWMARRGYPDYTAWYWPEESTIRFAQFDANALRDSLSPDPRWMGATCIGACVDYAGSREYWFRLKNNEVWLAIYDGVRTAGDSYPEAIFIMGALVDGVVCNDWGQPIRTDSDGLDGQRYPEVFERNPDVDFSDPARMELSIDVVMYEGDIA